MLKAIIQELEKIAPCYSLESFSTDKALLNPCFLCVDIEEKEKVGKTSYIPLFIYIYTPPNAISIRQKLKNEVKNILHKRKLERKESKGCFWIEFNKVIDLNIDKTLGKRFILLEFHIPSA